jgi:hypothetical protein
MAITAKIKPPNSAEPGGLSCTTKFDYLKPIAPFGPLSLEGDFGGIL